MDKDKKSSRIPLRNTIDEEVYIELKVLAVRLRRDANDVMEEAIRDLLVKYQNNPEDNRS